MSQKGKKARNTSVISFSHIFGNKRRKKERRKDTLVSELRVIVGELILLSMFAEENRVRASEKGFQRGCLLLCFILLGQEKL